MISRIKNRIKRFFVSRSGRDPITGQIALKGKRVSLGNNLASWTIPEGLLSDQSVCYLVGAGEDISFDIAVAERYHCSVLTIDPTPRAIKHFETQQKLMESKKVSEYIRLLPVGVWKSNGTMKFYSPADPSHVSHSLVNLQKTETFFEAEVRTLTSIMHDNKHSIIDLLKIDIEGAEYEVIKSFISEGIRPKVVCIEYDEAFNPLDDKFKTRISESLNLLLENGYQLFHLDYPGNYTLELKK